MHPESDGSRRSFLRLVGVTGTAIVVPPDLIDIRGKTSQVNPAQPKKEEDISPAEDLMREHGVLNRLLLVYEEAGRRLDNTQDPKPEVLRDSAEIVQLFIESYHERLEEDFLFPRFEKANRHVDLVGTLRRQHEAGRRLTERILQLSTSAGLGDPRNRMGLSDALRGFIRMYRPHAAREDTILFPAFRSLMTATEIDALGDAFEEKEHQLFGDKGFETIVDSVADLESAIGIHDLAQFTPRI